MKKTAFFFAVGGLIFFISGCASSVKHLSKQKGENNKQEVFRGSLSDADRQTGTAISAPASSEGEAALYEYVDIYNSLAIEEMKRTGIPASIKLAQAILESGAGQSAFAQLTRNHFGIKCGAEWDGLSYHHTDDDTDADGNLVSSCFRVYDEVRQSFLDHSYFLSAPNKAYRYGFLFDIPRTDYIGWAEGLQQSGYATNPDYADRLISIIERLNLQRFDTSPNPAPFSSDRIITFNKAPAVLTIKGETMASIALITGFSIDTLLAFNHYRYKEDQLLDVGTPIYLEGAGKVDMPAVQEIEAVFHTVVSGDTLYSLSKKYGISLKKIKELNNLSSTDISFGQKLRIR